MIALISVCAYGAIVCETHTLMEFTNVTKRSNCLVWIASNVTKPCNKPFNNQLKPSI